MRFAVFRPEFLLSLLALVHSTGQSLCTDFSDYSSDILSCSARRDSEEAFGTETSLSAEIKRFGAELKELNTEMKEKIQEMTRNTEKIGELIQERKSRNFASAPAGDSEENIHFSFSNKGDNPIDARNTAAEEKATEGNSREKSQN